jgi:phosphate-selective porin OprO/OprP
VLSGRIFSNKPAHNGPNQGKPVTCPVIYCARLILLLASILIFVQTGNLYAQDEVTGSTLPDGVAVTDCSDRSAEEDPETTIAEGQQYTDPCQKPEEEPLPAENQQQLAEDIADNTQDAMTLRRLLLGRSYSFFGRLEAEYAGYLDGILEKEDGFQLRRARVGIVGVLTDTLSYKGELDVTDGSNNFSDFYLKWDGSRVGSLTIGNQRVSQNLSAMTGALSLIFMEYPLPVTTFSLARRLAVSLDRTFPRFGFHGMVFGTDPNNNAGKKGLAIRGFANPVRSDFDVTHVGVSFVREKMDRDIRYDTRPESNVTDIRLVDTGPYSEVDHQNTLGLEFAAGRGSTTLRVEGFASRWEHANSKNTDFYGAYLELGRFLTGQEFRYDHGRFMRPQVDEGVRAWEAGLRLSWVDLNDGDVRGGEQWNAGLAINYYHRQNIRAMFNVLYYSADRDPGDEKGWIVQTRIQLNWNDFNWFRKNR